MRGGFALRRAARQMLGLMPPRASMSIIERLELGLIAGFGASKIVNAQGEGVRLGIVGAVIGGLQSESFDTPRSELNSCAGGFTTLPSSRSFAMSGHVGLQRRRRRC
jgi:uncharacterized membrane protein YeaQ/YmgE (transglycosylase-associated protein family)